MTNTNSNLLHAYHQEICLQRCNELYQTILNKSQVDDLIRMVSYFELSLVELSKECDSTESLQPKEDLYIATIDEIDTLEGVRDTMYMMRDLGLHGGDNTLQLNGNAFCGTMSRIISELEFLISNLSCVNPSWEVRTLLYKSQTK